VELRATSRAEKSRASLSARTKELEFKRRAPVSDPSAAINSDNMQVSTPLYTVRVEDGVLITRLRAAATDALVDRTNTAALTSSSNVEDDGPTSWLPRATVAADKTQVRWRKKIGEDLVVDVEAIHAEWNREGRSWARSEITQARLEAFPVGYVLYSIKRPSDFGRLDHSLYCESLGTEYRSPEQFAPHLAWIMEGQQRNSFGKTLCKCSHCNKSGPAQKEISQRYEDVRAHFARYKQSSNPRRREQAVSTRTEAGGREGRRRFASSLSTGRASHTRNATSSSNAPIRAKDYTKLNLNQSTVSNASRMQLQNYAQTFI
jgi:hypothetical protein